MFNFIKINFYFEKRPIDNACTKITVKRKSTVVLKKMSMCSDTSDKLY